MKNSITISSFFDNFVSELVECKKIAIKTNGVNVSNDTENIKKRLTNYIIDQSSFLKQGSGDFVLSNLEEVIYIMVALADECFLNLEWCGNSDWGKKLLEDDFFKMHSAGDNIFKKIDDILERKNFFLIDLAKIYLKMLALGFLGKYRGSKSTYEIDLYKEKLYTFISNSSNFNLERRFFERSYNFTLTGLPKIYLPNEYIFDYVAYALFAIIIVGTSVFWFQEVDYLNNILDLLISTNGEQG